MNNADQNETKQAEKDNPKNDKSISGAMLRRMIEFYEKQNR